MSKEYEKMVKVKQYTCLRCQHSWEPRKDKPPVSCPACRSPYWSRPRKHKESEA